MIQIQDLIVIWSDEDVTDFDNLKLRIKMPIFYTQKQSIGSFWKKL